MKRILFTYTTLVFMAALAVSPCSAQERSNPYALEEVTVTARAVPTPISRTPGGVEVMDAEEIEEIQPVNISDMAARAPGVDVSADSPWGADVSIRGLSRDSVVFLIDGCRVNTTTDINGRFGLVNPEDVERIEILKGPVSTLYGSGSIGGVVNVITKKGRFAEGDIPEWHGGLAGTTGSNPVGAGGYGALSYNAKNLWVYGSGSWREYQSFYDGGGDLTPNSQYRDFYGKAATGYRWDSGAVTEVQFQRVEGEDIGVPGGSSPPLPSSSAAKLTLGSNDRSLFQAVHTIKPEDGPIKESRFELYYQLITRNPRINQVNGAMAKPSADHETVGGKWTNVLGLGDHTLTAGLDAWNWYMTSKRDRYNPAGVLIGTDHPTPDANQFSGGLFLEDDWALAERWTLNLGGRGDWVSISNAGNVTANQTVEAGTREDFSWGGHAGLTFQATERWSLTSLAAASYRTPNILELFKDINLTGGIKELGDPDLDPERSFFFEQGFHYTGPTLRATTSFYANFIEDMINAQYVNATTYRMANVGRAEIYGVEQSLEWDFVTDWTAYGNIAYADGEDVKNGQPLRNVSPLNGLLGVRNHLTGAFWWELECEWAAEQTHVPDGALPTDAWEIVNARAGYDFHLDGLKNQIVLAGTNLFNEVYNNYQATSRGLVIRQPGAAVTATWRVSF
ncbi:MAG: TonB-dependent receptor plug domain-containing protein [Desulfovibrio aminophilus]|uniref:TonB-dependent receptor plug domain-containing protein n=1 Tax=Desulfovibrio aminophilus TaxID=81425 RepID=UPI0039E919D3